MMNTTTDGRTFPSGRACASAAFYLSAALAFALSSAATIYFSRSMSGGMDMPGGWTMSMMWMPMPGQTWFASSAMFVMMWLAMMVAMMLPSALPMLRTFHRSLAVEGYTHAGTSTLLVAFGYFAVWTAIGIVLYGIGVFWAFAIMRWPRFGSMVPILTGATLVLAGAFQFSRWKMAGLGHCRDPRVCSTIEKRSGPWAGWLHGFRQGVFCGICCSGLMLALLALGVMNPFVMLAVAAVIAAEKLLSKPQPVVHITGILAVAEGIVIVIRSLS